MSEIYVFKKEKMFQEYKIPVAGRILEKAEKKKNCSLILTFLSFPPRHQRDPTMTSFRSLSFSFPMSCLGEKGNSLNPMLRENWRPAVWRDKCSFSIFVIFVHFKCTGSLSWFCAVVFSSVEFLELCECTWTEGGCPLAENWLFLAFVFSSRRPLWIYPFCLVMPSCPMQRIGRFVRSYFLPVALLELFNSSARETSDPTSKSWAKKRRGLFQVRWPLSFYFFHFFSFFPFSSFFILSLALSFILTCFDFLDPFSPFGPSLSLFFSSFFS